MRVWGDSRGRANAVVSELRKRGYAVVLGRLGRKRLYRLLSPEDVQFAVLHSPNLELVRAEHYRPLIIKALRGLRSGLQKRLVSVGLYGSLSRGTCSKNSDVDLYVVADWPSKRLSGRLDESVSCVGGLEDERLRLSRVGITADVSIHPVVREEARSFYSLHLDLSREGVVLYDPTGFLGETWFRMRAWLVKREVERVETEKGWFWRLDPGIEIGSKV